MLRVQKILRVIHPSGSFEQLPSLSAPFSENATPGSERSSDQSFEGLREDRVSALKDFYSITAADDSMLTTSQMLERLKKMAKQSDQLPAVQNTISEVKGNYRTLIHELERLKKNTKTTEALPISFDKSIKSLEDCSNEVIKLEEALVDSTRYRRSSEKSATNNLKELDSCIGRILAKREEIGQMKVQMNEKIDVMNVKLENACAGDRIASEKGPLAGDGAPELRNEIKSDRAHQSMKPIDPAVAMSLLD